MSEQRKIIYPGSFNPLTFGHVNVIKRALRAFGELTVAVTDNSPKRALFSVEECVELLEHVFLDRSGLKIVSFEGLLVKYMHREGFRVILRGIRSVSDYEYEQRMDHANRILDNKVETVFLMTENKFSHLSSTLIKEIARLGGSLKDMVPPVVEKAVSRKLEN